MWKRWLVLCWGLWAFCFSSWAQSPEIGELIQELRKELNGLQSDLETLRRNNNELKNINEMLNASLQRMRDSYNQVKTEFDALKNSWTELNSLNESLRTKNRMLILLLGISTGACLVLAVREVTR